MEHKELMPAPRKRSYTWLVVVVFLLMMTAASALAIISKNKNDPSQASEVEVSPDASFAVVTPFATSEPEALPTEAPLPTTAPPSYVKTAIIIDGEQAIVLSSRQAAEELMRNVESHFKGLDTIPQDSATVLMNFIEYMPADEEAQPVDYDAAFEYLTGSGTPLVFESRAGYFQYESLAHEDEVVYTDTLPLGYRLVKTYGSDGLIKTAYSAVYINGVRKELNESEQTVVYPAVNGMIYIGTADPASLEAPFTCFGDAPLLPEGFELGLPLDGKLVSAYGFYDGGFRHGIDIEKNAGAVVKAAADGVVVSVMERGAYGILVEIEHEEGVTTRYARLGGASVEVGDTVSAGQAIGTVAGGYGGSRIHFELRYKGYSYDPMPYFADSEQLVSD